MQSEKLVKKLFPYFLLTILILPILSDRCPGVAFVMHSHNKNNEITDFHMNTWLYDTNLIVITGQDIFDTQNNRRLSMERIVYNGNPGYKAKDWCSIGYYGAHRTMAGVLIANDTFSPNWIYVLDDDDYFNVEVMCNVFSSLDPSIPLLLGTPGRNTGKCFDTSTPDHWNCCKSLKTPCYAYLNQTNDDKQVIFRYDEEKETMSIWKYCLENSNDCLCCSADPWPQGIMYGYPYHLHNPLKPGNLDKTHYSNIYNDSGFVLHHKLYRPHFGYIWPYGGATYSLSKGLLQEIGREDWEKSMYTIQCGNADHRVMTTVFNHGFSITVFDGHATHHLHSIEAFIAKIDGDYEKDKKNEMNFSLLKKSCSYLESKEFKSSKISEICLSVQQE